MAAVRKKILILDDEKDFVLMLKARLESIGDYEVVGLTDSRDMVKCLHEFNPDVILLDIVMPVVDGLDICDILNNDSVGAVTPIIIVSGLDRESDKLKAFKAGVVDYIVKPVDQKKLIAAIDKAVKKAPGD